MTVPRFSVFIFRILLDGRNPPFQLLTLYHVVGLRLTFTDRCSLLDHNLLSLRISYLIWSTTSPSRLSLPPITMMNDRFCTFIVPLFLVAIFVISLVLYKYFTPNSDPIKQGVPDNRLMRPLNNVIIHVLLRDR